MACPNMSGKEINWLPVKKGKRVKKGIIDSLERDTSGRLPALPKLDSDRS